MALSLVLGGYKAQASTLYQETTASSTKQYFGSAYQLVGTFSTSETKNLTGGVYQLSARANTTGQCLNAYMGWRLGLSPTTNSNDIIIFSDSGQHILTTATSTYTGTFGTYSLTTGFYYIFVLPLCNDNTGDGMLLETNSSQDRFSGYITDSGGFYVSPTHFISFTFSTTTDEANITGYWEATTTPHINQRLTFWQYTALFGQTNYKQIIATTTGFFDYSFPFTEPVASSTSTGTTTPSIIPSYVLNASLDQFDNTLAASLGYPDDSIDYEGYKIGLDATSTIISSITLDYTATLQALLNYPEYECGITSITGCIKNALVWLFYPTADTITNYYNFIALVQSKPPVGYFMVVKSNISNLSATSTKAFNVVVPNSLKQYIFTPFDTGIAGILWLFFIFNFYKRLKHITI